jgi:hypothetical protein
MWDEVIDAKMIEPSGEALTEWQVSTLWTMFAAISQYWELDFAVDLLRSRWLDMIEAQSIGAPDYRGEYANAASVFDAMVKTLGEEEAITLLYGKTIVAKPEDAKTRLGHAKFHVANDFIRCFVATGGFRGFVKNARNYTGFMGGSRFREWAPVRTGKLK